MPDEVGDEAEEAKRHRALDPQVPIAVRDEAGPVHAAGADAEEEEKNEEDPDAVRDQPEAGEEADEDDRDGEDEDDDYNEDDYETSDSDGDSGDDDDAPPDSNGDSSSSSNDDDDEDDGNEEEEDDGTDDGDDEDDDDGDDEDNSPKTKGAKLQENKGNNSSNNSTNSNFNGTSFNNNTKNKSPLVWGIIGGFVGAAVLFLSVKYLGKLFLTILEVKYILLQVGYVCLRHFQKREVFLLRLVNEQPPPLQAWKAREEELMKRYLKMKEERCVMNTMDAFTRYYNIN